MNAIPFEGPCGLGTLVGATPDIVGLQKALEAARQIIAQEVTSSRRNDALEVIDAALASKPLPPTDDVRARGEPIYGPCGCDGFSFGHEPDCDRKIVGYTGDSAQSPPPADDDVEPKGQKPAPWPGAIAGIKYTPHLSFEGGGLGIRVQGYGDADGDGWFVFRDDDLDFEQDDGPLYRIANIPNSELVEIRDFLLKIFPLATPSLPQNYAGQAVVTDSEILIRFPIDALQTALDGAFTLGAICKRYIVTDPAAFAKDLANTLNAEDEEGTTRIHKMMDTAMEKAIGDGAFGIDEPTAPASAPPKGDTP